MNEASKPLHIAVVMDGNRRFARREGMSVPEGHTRGYRKLRAFVEWARASGATHITAYGFSTENWKRDPSEVSALMGLFSLAIEEMLPELRVKRIRLRFIGDRSRLPAKLARAMMRAEEVTKEGAALTLIVAISYGARDEIVRAARAIASSSEAEIDEEGFAAFLDTKDVPDPDIVLRTGGERRLSNFLLWQSAYSELFFVDTLWPDLAKEEFDAVLCAYHSRVRRHGV